MIVVHTLDRLGRTVRDTLNLIHELSERGIGVRNLADPSRIDSTDPEDPMAQLAVVLLALFAQMERTYTMERAAHARAVATAKGRRVGRPVLVDAAKLEWAEHLRDQGDTIAEIVKKTGIARTSLYRHLPPRPAPAVTADGGPPSGETACRDRAAGRRRIETRCRLTFLSAGQPGRIRPLLRAAVGGTAGAVLSPRRARPGAGRPPPRRSQPPRLRGAAGHRAVPGHVPRSPG